MSSKNKYIRDVSGKQQLSIDDVLNAFEVRDQFLREAFTSIVKVGKGDRNSFLLSPHKDWIDVYDVLDGFCIANSAAAHATKKILCCGVRGHKNKEEDLLEIITALARAIALE